MKLRILEKTIERARKTFPAIVVTGPRQSGKTTLLKKMFVPKYSYVNLENPDARFRASEDPVGFLSRYKLPLIIDEIQYVPELLSYIKTKIDEDRKPGQWILTGSQNFALMHGVSQSLAGRAAVLTLLPFSQIERFDGAANKIDLAEVILRGCYPEIASNPKVDRQIWCGSYITTYLERDVRNLEQVGNLSQFELFLRACAVRTGQLLNLSEIARDLGISVPTAKRWLSLLETGYQVILLYPYYRNVGKRTIKSPKIYFNDTGLASYLLGLHDKETLLNSPYFGSLFETMVVTDLLKRFYGVGLLPSLYFLRTRDELEVDLVIERKQKLQLWEIKSGSTITANHAVSLKRAKNDLGERVESASVISASKESFSLGGGIYNYSWQDVLLKKAMVGI